MGAPSLSYPRPPPRILTRHIQSQVLTATPGPPYSRCMRPSASSASNSHRTFWRFQTT
ncbi:hypothetical protein BC937DRAFT_93927 [Endogone sp. FLAS-F59071]|nr:hypothetical protein BC937DRAFT_93927 [Endogone sp. FLAS-F59071]|eukprot:RUS14368.1 hypothetical protein BC937DRAFT_93927 [Endogone sp. FLAS-F59071]